MKKSSISRTVSSPMSGCVSACRSSASSVQVDAVALNAAPAITNAFVMSATRAPEGTTTVRPISRRRSLGVPESAAAAASRTSAYVRERALGWSGSVPERSARSADTLAWVR